MEEVAREVLPAGYTFAWSGLAFEEKKSGGTSSAAFVLGLVIVFLVLAAQYESWTLPGAVMTAVPFGILGALVLNWLRGLENDVYFQIGLLVLIGLGAKNALLRVTFAVDLRKQGRSLMDATIEAGEMRLRPIIMTSLAFVLGVLPLAVATGVGANSRHSIGTGIIGGMLGETTLAMLYVPLFFYLFETLTERLRGHKEPPPARRRGARVARHAGAPRRGAVRCAAWLWPRSPSSPPAACVGPELPAARGRDAAGLPYEVTGRAADRRHRLVAAVRGPGARRPRRRGARQQQERQDRRRQRRAGRGRAARRPARRSTRRSAPAPAARERARQRGRGDRRSRRRCRTRRPPRSWSAASSWELDLWGRVRRLSEAAQADAAGHRGGAPRGDPLARRLGGERLPAAARPRRAARDRAADPGRPTPSRCGCSSCSSSTASSRR